MWLFEVKKSILRRPYSFAVMLLLVTATMTMCNLLVQNARDVAAQGMRYQSVWDRGSIYAVNDRLFMDPRAERDYFQSEASLPWIKRYLNALEENDRFPYYINGRHQLEIPDCGLPGQFHLFTPDGAGNHIVGAVQFNERYVQDFPIALAEGRSFASPDYIYRGDFIPVIVGSAFQEIYEVGDVFSAEFMTIPVRCKVVGIAQRDAMLVLQEQIQYLDRYVMMPALHFDAPPKDEEEAFFQKANYLQHCSGYFRAEDDGAFGALAAYFEATKEKYGVFPIEIAQSDETQMAYLHLISDGQIQNIRRLSILLAALSALILSVGMYAGVLANARSYAILAACGASRLTLCSYVLGEWAVLCILACMLSLLFPFWLFNVYTGLNGARLLALLAGYLVCALPALIKIYLMTPESIVKELR